MQDMWISWNENIKHPYERYHQPQSENEIVNIVKNAKSLRVVGTGRSSADIIAGTSDLLDLSKYNKVISIDKANKQATVQAGILLSDLIPALEEQGLCIPCLPDIDSITLGGALATGTHGTGWAGHPISGYLDSCKLIKADGEILHIDKKNLLMDAIRTSIGVLGILSEVTLQCESLYWLQIEEGPVKDKHWLPSYRDNLKINEFYRLLWLPHTGYGYEIKGHRIHKDDSIKTKKAPFFIKYRRAWSKILYGAGERFPSLIKWANILLFLFFFRWRSRYKGTLYGGTVTKSRGSTLELAEWTIPLSSFEKTFSALKARFKEERVFAHIPMDIRYIAEDQSWLGYAYREGAVTVGCISRRPKSADHYKAFDIIEEVFLEFQGRPHWAKRFKVRGQKLGQLYPRWNDFRKLRQEFDPQGKFLNGYLKRLFFEES